MIRVLKTSQVCCGLVQTQVYTKQVGGKRQRTRPRGRLPGRLGPSAPSQTPALAAPISSLNPFLLCVVASRQQAQRVCC